MSIDRVKWKTVLNTQNSGGTCNNFVVYYVLSFAQNGNIKYKIYTYKNIDISTVTFVWRTNNDSRARERQSRLNVLIGDTT